MGTPNRMNELVHLLAKMRLAQIQYFKYRTTPEKEWARKLERELDPILKAIGDRGPHLQTDVRELAALAQKMRAKQRAFFSTWNRDIMREAMKLEKQLDGALEAIDFQQKNPDSQLNLFND